MTVKDRITFGTLVTGVRIEIGGDYDGDPKATVFMMDGAAYEAYTDAETAFRKARVARDKALGEPIRYPKGICNFWILNVRLTKKGNEYIPVGSEGNLNVIETSVDRKVLKALFYPAGKSGFGEVTWPGFERIGR